MGFHDETMICTSSLSDTAVTADQHHHHNQHTQPDHAPLKNLSSPCLAHHLPPTQQHHGGDVPYSFTRHTPCGNDHEGF